MDRTDNPVDIEHWVEGRLNPWLKTAKPFFVSMWDRNHLKLSIEEESSKSGITSQDSLTD